MNTSNVIQLRPHQIEEYRNAHCRDAVKVRGISPRERIVRSTELSPAQLFAESPRLVATALRLGWAKMSNDKTPVRIPDKGIHSEAARRRHASAQHRRAKLNLLLA